MVIIPDWTVYTGRASLTALSLQAPYQSTSADVDSDFEAGGFSGGKIDSITADQITTGTLTAVATLGGGTTGFVRIDGTTNRLLVNDGTTNRVAIGNLP